MGSSRLRALAKSATVANGEPGLRSTLARYFHRRNRHYGSDCVIAARLTIDLLGSDDVLGSDDLWQR